MTVGPDFRHLSYSTKLYILFFFFFIYHQIRVSKQRMGFPWPSIGRWTSRRARSSSASLEPLRGVPAGHAMTTTVCYSPNGGNQHVSPSELASHDETSSSPPSSPACEHQQPSPTGCFGVQETEALAKDEPPPPPLHALDALRRRQKEAERRLRSDAEGKEAHSHAWARAISSARERGQEKAAP
ncbi:hypothetical protein LZ30DRAFT_274794 [Colletotrichum cereale]|nr:hypothetical protein LZ30DRAFT_274794 [Colletotrichum cereale]